MRKRQVNLDFLILLVVVTTVSACGSEEEQSSMSDAAVASPIATKQDSSDVGLVTAIMDDREYEWTVPTPNTENCTIYHGVVGIVFQNAAGDSSIKIVTSGIEAIVNNQYEYRATRDPLSPEEFTKALTIDGNTVTYKGPLRRTAYRSTNGFDSEIVDATITAICY